MEKTCFCKSITKKQKDEFKSAVQKALKALNKKNLSLIIHGASFPSIKEEDTGFGTPNSTGGRNFIEFINNLGFNSIQLGPEGKTKSIDASPYMSTLFSNNPLFIDLKKLTEKEYCEILSPMTFERIVHNNPAENNRTAYEYIYKENEAALKEAYANFKVKLEKGEAKAKKLNKDFEAFKQKNKYWLEKDSLYEAISIKNGNDYWPIWKDELDKNLYNAEGKFSPEQVNQRIKELQEQFCEEIELYEFIQFIAYSQRQDTTNFVLNKKMKTIADAQVAFSDRDYWSNQAYFLQGYSLGVPPDVFSADGQAWGFPVMDPSKIFNEDGSLSEGGLVMKSRFEKMFEENPGGVRIDHIIGLIDPYVYKSGSLPKTECGAARLFSAPEHEELAKYANIRIKDLNNEVSPDSEYRVEHLTDNQIADYAKIIEKIVLQAAKEKGIDKEFIICEDLGTVTNPVLAVMEKFELSGLRVTQFVDPEKADHPYRVKNTEPKHWVMIGSHDNMPFVCWVNELYQQNKIWPHAVNLAADLKESNHEEFAQHLCHDRTSFITTKFAELFASNAENIQIFFTDLFGVCERYNMPGTSGSENWSLRVPNNYECFYYDQLAKGEAMNIPETLMMAMESKGKKFLSKHNDTFELLKKYAELFKKDCH